MDKSNWLPEQIERERAIDEKHPSPSIRATYIYNLLRERSELSQWDVVCFCAEYLALTSVGFPFIQDEAKRLVIKIYAAHYGTFEGLDENERGSNIPNDAQFGDRPKEHGSGFNPESSRTDDSN